VPYENKFKIFDWGFSTRSNLDKEGGIGLAFCRQAIGDHDGSIAENGVPGEGARFDVRLPLIAPFATGGKA
jgi:signal transduction histidine kinase